MIIPHTKLVSIGNCWTRMKIQTNPALALRARAGLVWIFILVQQFPILTPLACGIIPFLFSKYFFTCKFGNQYFSILDCLHTNRAVLTGRKSITARLNHAVLISILHGWEIILERLKNERFELWSLWYWFFNFLNTIWTSFAMK